MSRPLRGLGVAGLALLMLVGQAPEARAQAFELITASEAQQEASAEAAETTAKPEVRTRGLPAPKDPAAPSIRVVAPAVQNAPTAAPLRIELAFKPAPGARIVPSSFRVLYGLLKIDLTDRLRKNATVTEAGVVVQGAKVPDGQHRLILQVADDKGNTAEQELRIRVGKG